METPEHFEEDAPKVHHAAQEGYNRRLEEVRGGVNRMIADVDGEFMKAKIEADVYYEKQQLLAKAIKVESKPTGIYKYE